MLESVLVIFGNIPVDENSTSSYDQPADASSIRTSSVHYQRGLLKYDLCVATIASGAM